MKVKITNIDIDIINIEDLGIILNPNDFTYLDCFHEVSIKDSIELKNLIESSKLKIEIDSKEMNYQEFISTYNTMNEIDHENLHTLKHSFSENSFVKVEKENNVVKKIIYYTDSSMNLKIREEEIIKENGKCSKIILSQYNDDGNILYTETQNINRNSLGKVESIGIIKK